MQIAYLILAHAQAPQLARLVNRLNSTDAHFYLHIDANTSPEVFAAMQLAVNQTGARTHWIERQSCRWGGFSLVDATLRLMAAAQADDCDWLVLLSGQDYPLQSNAAIAEYLGHTDKLGFIDLRALADFDVRYRFESFHFEALNARRTGRLLQKIQRQLNHWGLCRTPPIPLDEIRAGSQWWILSATACRWLLEFCTRNPQVVRFFQRTLVPDEMFFQSLLWHSPMRSQLCFDPLRRIEWEDGAWSPRTFNETDLSRLLAAPELFARKFAPDGQLTAQLDAIKTPHHI